MWFSSAESLSHVRFLETPWTAARQASLSITNSRSLLKLMSTESVMPSNHLILCHPLLLLPSVFSSIRDFSNESLHQVAIVLEFSVDRIDKMQSNLQFYLGKKAYSFKKWYTFLRSPSLGLKKCAKERKRQKKKRARMSPKISSHLVWPHQHDKMRTKLLSGIFYFGVTWKSNCLTYVSLGNGYLLSS